MWHSYNLHRMLLIYEITTWTWLNDGVETTVLQIVLFYVTLTSSLIYTILKMDEPHKKIIFQTLNHVSIFEDYFLPAVVFVNVTTFLILSEILLGWWELASVHLITFSWHSVDTIHWGSKLCTHLICLCFFFYEWNSWIDPVSLS